MTRVQSGSIAVGNGMDDGAYLTVVGSGGTTGFLCAHDERRCSEEMIV